MNDRGNKSFKDRGLESRSVPTEGEKEVQKKSFRNRNVEGGTKTKYYDELRKYYWW